MKTNGHESRAAWNVALWLFNDEGLYKLVKYETRKRGTKNDAARRILEQLPEKTPDGYTYSYTTVRKAIVGNDL